MVTCIALTYTIDCVNAPPYSRESAKDERSPVGSRLLYLAANSAQCSFHIGTFIRFDRIPRTPSMARRQGIKDPMKRGGNLGTSAPSANS